jgi:hypothetical protein
MICDGTFGGGTDARTAYWRQHGHAGEAEASTPKSAFSIQLLR